MSLPWLIWDDVVLCDVEDEVEDGVEEAFVLWLAVQETASRATVSINATQATHLDVLNFIVISILSSYIVISISYKYIFVKPQTEES